MFPMVVIVEHGQLNEHLDVIYSTTWLPFFGLFRIFPLSLRLCDLFGVAK